MCRLENVVQSILQGLRVQRVLLVVCVIHGVNGRLVSLASRFQISLQLRLHLRQACTMRLCVVVQRASMLISHTVKAILHCLGQCLMCLTHCSLQLLSVVAMLGKLQANGSMCFLCAILNLSPHRIQLALQLRPVIFKLLGDSHDVFLQVSKLPSQDVDLRMQKVHLIGLDLQLSLLKRIHLILPSGDFLHILLFLLGCLCCASGGRTRGTRWLWRPQGAFSA
mmetsp:Transcript_151251/g.277779  ORF Transcript_151251/g.277779 Transcript_151251/m.277779 type:complete len:223 (-) Transcript_151251:250-918(-)